MMKGSLSCALLALLACMQVHASNTSGVYGPLINPADRSAQLRTAFAPGRNGASDAWLYRVHYQEALNDDFRWRVVTQFRDRDDGFEFDDIRAELLWHYQQSQQGGWDSGLRFDIRARKGSRPESFAINWSNQLELTPDWRLLGLVIGSWNFGGAAQGGTQLETRSSLTYKLEGGGRLGVEMFNSFGRIHDMGSFNDQRHQIGPVLTGNFEGLRYQLGYLAGVTGGSDDHTFRLWLARSF